MSAAQHTPGPWRVGPVDDTRVEDASGNEVAQIDGDYNQPDTWPLMEANARLIAAAPDMLAALREMVAAEDAYEGFCENDERCAAARAQARDAIAKAEGRS